MAAALARHLLGREVYFSSVGVRAGSLDDFAVAVMDEIGLDISHHRPMSFEDLEDSSFDLIVTLSPEAHHKALELTRTLSVEVVYWPTPDPSAATGSRQQILDSYRSVREALMKRIKTTFDWRPFGQI
jgi:protein-tyrosine-phosphatase